MDEGDELRELLWAALQDLRHVALKVVVAWHEYAMTDDRYEHDRLRDAVKALEEQL